MAKKVTILLPVVAAVLMFAPVAGVMLWARLKDKKQARHLAEWHELIRHHEELDAHLDTVWELYSRD